MTNCGARAKDQLMADYLKQQTAAARHALEADDGGADDDESSDEGAGDGTDGDAGEEEGGIVAIPSNEEMEDFKNQVRAWLEYDNTAAKLKQALKERKKAQDALTEKIGAFMSRFNIEDLNTKQGKLRCRIVEVKTPLTQKQIKERLAETLTAHKRPEEVMSDVFRRDGTVQKVVLRRLKRGGAMTIA